MSRIVLPTACAFMRHARVAICEILFREPISSTNQSICCIARMAVIYLLEAAGQIQFCDMISAATPRAFLSRQNPAVLMAPRVWHSATTVSSTLPVAIQRRSCVTTAKMADHPASHSSRVLQTIRSSYCWSAEPLRATIDRSSVAHRLNARLQND